MVENQRQQKPNKAMWLSVIPGLGQLYNKQIVKGGSLISCFLPRATRNCSSRNSCFNRSLQSWKCSNARSLLIYVN